jgi:hypothetical protein
MLPFVGAIPSLQLAGVLQFPLPPIQVLVFYAMYAARNPSRLYPLEVRL